MSILPQLPTLTHPTSPTPASTPTPFSLPLADSLSRVGVSPSLSRSASTQTPGPVYCHDSHLGSIWEPSHWSDEPQPFHARARSHHSPCLRLASAPAPTVAGFPECAMPASDIGNQCPARLTEIPVLLHSNNTDAFDYDHHDTDDDSVDHFGPYASPTQLASDSATSPLRPESYGMLVQPMLHSMSLATNAKGLHYSSNPDILDLPP